MIKVKIYTILELKKIVGQREIEISVPEGSTVKDLIFRMVETWGEGLSPHLFYPGTDRLLPHVRLMVNGRDIQFLKGLETVLKDEDEFSVLPLVAGG